jgi:hypothetical protein
MTMWTWVALAVAVAVIAAITGMKPKGSRPVANTRLMGVGRVLLIVMALIFLVVAFRG